MTTSDTIGIDTGCLYGERLTAYSLPDDKFISIKSKKVYNDYHTKFFI